MDNTTDLKKLIKEYLKQARLMQLATSIDNQPWVCSVWFGFDDELNLYWFSSTTRRHSKEVAINQKVAGAIVVPHTPEDKPRGIQFQGIAEPLVKQNDIDKAISVYVDRIFSRDTITKLMDSKERPHRFYKIKVSLYVLFDVLNFPDNSRQELVL